MRKRRGPTPAKGWEPLTRRVAYITDPAKEAARRNLMILAGMDPDMEMEMWGNDRYIVVVDRDPGGDVSQLSIRRHDRKAARDWRDFQRIKTQLAGPEVEAVELYPAESRVVDTTNQFHLWCVPPGVKIAIGFENGMRLDPGEGPEMGAIQRPFDEADPERQSWPEYLAESEA